jgi:hypothetical protein
MQREKTPQPIRIADLDVRVQEQDVSRRAAARGDSDVIADREQGVPVKQAQPLDASEERTQRENRTDQLTRPVVDHHDFVGDASRLAQ